MNAAPSANTAAASATKRQSLPDKLMPEWEELCATAMAVENLHLMATAMSNVGVFWSSHTWAKEARDSKEMKAYLNFDEEDRVMGALVVGRYPEGKSFRWENKEL